MGSFNTTCFASQQTIAPYDECLVFAISQSSGYKPVAVEYNGKSAEVYGVTDSTCYSNCFWHEDSPMLEAKYEDYGRVELLDTPANRVKLFSMVCEWRRLPVVAQGENPYHDCPVNVMAEIEKLPKLNEFFAKHGKSKRIDFPLNLAVSDETWTELVQIFDHVWEGTQEHRAFVDYQGRAVPMQFAIISKQAADELVRMSSEWKGYGGESYEPETYFKAMLVSNKPEALGDGEKDTARNYFASYKIRESLGRIAGSGRNGWGNIGIDGAMMDLVMDAISGKITEDEAFKLFLPFVRGAYVMKSLEAINVKITPMVYAGQDYDNEIGRTYAKFVRAVSAKINKRCKERYA